MSTRTESDSLGEVEVAADKYWGAQTERSRRNFAIGPAASMPIEIIRAYALVKLAAATANHRLGRLPENKATLIKNVCEEIVAGRLDDQFPLVIWQTGSGTHTNMNLNEVIANRAQVLSGAQMTDSVRLVSPNDDVNMSQSSNDTFPSAMHLATYQLVVDHTLPSLEQLRKACAEKRDAFAEIVKIGRTHYMDATPITVGQEFGSYAQQIKNGIRAVNNALVMIAEIPLGASAVGTGLNTPPGYAALAVKILAERTGYPFVNSPNKFEALAAHDSMIEMSSALRRVAVSLIKIANDIRVLSSGPRCGIGELRLPANEPGSSIMPGKINPTQAEAITMVAAQIMGNDVAVGIGGANGHLQLNTYKPMIAANVLQSARLLGDACRSFAVHCVDGIEPDQARIEQHLKNSLMLVTSLSPTIGYAKAAEIAQRAYQQGSTIREAALSLGYIEAEEFDRLVDPSVMLGPE